jgi:hypothetical protein
MSVGGTLTINSGATFDVEGRDLTTASFDNYGTLRLLGAETLTGVTVDLTKGAIEYDGSGTTGLRLGDDYYDLKFSGSGYWTLSAALNVRHDLTIGEGATLDIEGKDITVSHYLYNFGTFRLIGTEDTLTLTMDTDSGTVAYDGTDSYLLLVLGYNYHSLDFVNGFWDLPQVLNVDGVLTISQNATLDANGNTIYVNKGWSKSGTFIHGNNTVVFDGTDSASVTGETTFYNLTCQTASKHIYFEAGSQQTVTEILTMEGSSSGLVYLMSMTPGTQWKIDPTHFSNSRVIKYAHVQDSLNVWGAEKQTYINPPSTCVDGGNNSWWFPPNPSQAATDPVRTWVPKDTNYVLAPWAGPNIASLVGSISIATDMVNSSDRKADRYSKAGYAKGKYKTVVIVFEGKVMVAEYDKSGPNIKKGKAVTGGQKVVQKGEIR